MYPQIVDSKCIKCNLCVEDCITKAIDPGLLGISQEKCFQCGHCLAICPQGAIEIPEFSKSKIHSLPNDFSANLEGLMAGRRSIRNFKKEQVERDIINKILNAAEYAPSGTNSRQLGVTIVNDRQKVMDINEMIMGKFKFLVRFLLHPLARPFLYMILGKKKLEKLMNYSRRMKDFWNGEDILTHGAPGVMIFHADRKSSTPDQDAVIAATSAMFMAESLGVGTCFNGFWVIGLGLSSKAKRCLSLPKGHKIYEVFAFGYSSVKYSNSFKRNDLKVKYV